MARQPYGKLDFIEAQRRPTRRPTALIYRPRNLGSAAPGVDKDATDAAQAQADSAQTAAASAQTTADGKNAVSYGAAPHSPAATGDLWFNGDTTTNCPDNNCTGHTLDGSGVPNVGAYPHRKTNWVHRYSGAAWLDALGIQSVAKSDIVDSAVISAKLADAAVGAAKLAAEAVTAEKIAAKAITVEKMVVTNFDNLISNPTSELGAVNGIGGQDVVLDAVNAYEGYYCRRSVGNASGNATTYLSDLVPANPGDKFYVEGQLKRSGGAGNCYVWVRWTDKDGNAISWGSGNSVASTSYALSSFAGTAPAGTVGVMFGYDGSGVGVGAYAFGDQFYARRMTGAELIVDGAITTTKLDALAVTTDKLAANAVTAAKIAAHTITAAEIAALAITAAEIAAGAVTAAKIAAASIQTSDYAYTGTIDTSNEVATAGARMRNNQSPGATLPSLIASPQGVKIGSYTASESVVTSLTALARSGTGVNDVAWYRGNININDVGGGSPLLIEPLWERGRAYRVGERVRSDANVTAAEYAGGTTYFWGNIVKYATSGGVYICYNDNSGAGISGIAPTTTANWEKIAAATADVTGAYCSETLGGRAPQRVYKCAGAGTSSTSSAGPTGTGTGITDGSATWDYVEPVTNERLIIVGRSVAAFTSTATFGSKNISLYTWNLTLQPRFNEDNWDAIRYLKFEARYNTQGTPQVIHTFYAMLPERLYKTPGTPSSANNAAIVDISTTRVDFATEANTATPYCYRQLLTVVPYGVNGPGAGRIYGGATNLAQAPNSTSTAYGGGHVVPGAAPPGSGGSGGGSGCPAPEVGVLMADGHYRPAGLLQVGDRIWTVPGGPSGATEPGEYEVTAVEMVENSERVAVVLYDGTRLVYSPKHLVMTPSGWNSAKNLRSGDRLLTLQGEVRVAHVVPVAAGKVVKITTSASTYITEGGVLNHNMKPQ